MRQSSLKLKRFSLVMIMVVFGHYATAAEDNSQLALLGADAGLMMPSPAGTATRISLDLRNIDVVEALKFLSMRSGLNIVPTQKVSGRVTLTVENVPVQDVFDIMLRSNNLAYDKKGEIHNVMTEQEYRALYGKAFSDTRQVKVLRLQYAVPDQAFSILEAVKSEIGRLLVEPESGTVLILDTPEKIEEAQKALDSLEQKGTIKVFSLKYAKAKDMVEQLKNQLDLKKVGSVTSDELNNQVIVQTLPERMKDIEKLIASLDKKTKEVLIEVKIIKIRMSDELDAGVEWEGIFGMITDRGLKYLGSYPFSAVQSTADDWRSRAQVLSDMGKKAGSYPFSGTATSYVGSKISPGEKLHIGVVNNKHDYDVVLKYLQTLGKTKIMANPTLAVINNQEAKIHIGERQAYVTTTTTTGSTTTTVSEEVTYVDVGVQLYITPTINDDGYVIMKIKPEISSVVDTLTTSSDNTVPILDTSSAETTVMAKDGTTIILGGLGKEEKTDSSEGLPVLSKIPLLGYFFRNSAKSTVRTELLIMLTPYIFDGDKLITPKDKDNEKSGIKRTKKFDIFRPEGPDEILPRAESLSNARIAVHTQPQAQPVAPAEASPLAGKTEGITKGFKDYDDNQIKSSAALTLLKGFATVDKQTPAPKDFRDYNLDRGD